MSVPSGYMFLSGQALDDTFGLLENLEGFEATYKGTSGSAHTQPGFVYIDTSQHASIGYGFNLNEATSNSLGAVLNEITVSVR